MMCTLVWHQKFILDCVGRGSGKSSVRTQKVDMRDACGALDDGFTGLYLVLVLVRLESMKHLFI